MSSVNYHETIVIPTLQKKLQELQNANLVLEVALLVEQAKVKDAGGQFKNEIDALKKCNDELESKNLRLTVIKTEFNLKNEELNKLQKNYDDLEQRYNREVSVKDSILAEYNLIKTEYDALKNTINKKK
jgi:chromosome segregation ATPase